MENEFINAVLSAVSHMQKAEEAKIVFLDLKRVVDRTKELLDKLTDEYHEKQTH